MNLAALREKAEAATEGPWRKYARPDDTYWSVGSDEHPREMWATLPLATGLDGHETNANCNADFIAAADPTTVLALIAVAEEHCDVREVFTGYIDCPGIEVEPGITSGCDANETGATDCPICGFAALDNLNRVLGGGQ